MRRIRVSVAALLLLAVACGGPSPDAPEGPGGYGAGLGSEDEASPSPEALLREATDGADASPGPTPQGRHTSRPAPPPAAPAPGGYFDNGPVGAMARDYLSGRRATRLVVEVDYIAGKAPRAGALRHLESILRREARKPDGVVVMQGQAISRSRSSWTFEDIAELEQRHRDHRSSGDTATMWIVYLDGALAGEPDTLGVAYRASAAALFPDQISRATTVAVNGLAVERAVLTHEAGHLLGLVNLVYDSPHDREDPRSPGHSTEQGSVMYAAVRDVSVAALLAGGPPDDFDAFDRDDLAALREGRS